MSPAASFVAAGALVFAVSGDLPFGTLASPGAGMMPKLVLGLMMAFGAIAAVARAGESPPLADIDWSDLPHAATVVARDGGRGRALYRRSASSSPCRCCCSSCCSSSSAGSCSLARALAFSARRARVVCLLCCSAPLLKSRRSIRDRA